MAIVNIACLAAFGGETAPQASQGRAATQQVLDPARIELAPRTLAWMGERKQKGAAVSRSAFCVCVWI